MTQIPAPDDPTRDRGARLPRIAGGLLGGAVVLLGWCALTSLEAIVYQARQSQRLDQILREIRSLVGPPDLGPGGAVATRVEAQASGLVGRIEIARVGLRAMVAEGVDGRTLRRAVGHLPDSAFPGEAGNAALSGHRDTFFRRLEEVRENDTIRITTPDGVFEYIVESLQVVEPSRTDVLQSGRAPELTLITCYPFRYVGSAPERYVVRARLRSVSPPGALGVEPTGVARSERNRLAIRSSVGHTRPAAGPPVSGRGQGPVVAPFDSIGG